MNRCVGPVVDRKTVGRMRLARTARRRGRQVGGAIDACQNAEGSVLVGEEPDLATADEAAAGGRHAGAS
jgi:hypothetical protein